MFDSNQFFSGGAAEFYPKTIDQSLRFNDNDSAYLSRTPASAGNEETWTFSCWVKKCEQGSWQGLLAVGTADGSEDVIAFDTTDRLTFRHTTGSDVKTSARFRDPSAWYHIMVVADTTKAQTSSTASDSRLRFYVNGSQVVDFDEATMPSQNHSFRINTAAQHYLGEFPRISAHLNGYLAEVHFTDGTAYTADAFGELKSGVWVAKAPSVSYGTNGFYLDFANSADIGNDVSGNANDWTPNNFTASDVVLDSPTDNFATWNPLARNFDYNNPTHTLSDGNLKATSLSLDNARAYATIGVTSGQWYWEVTVLDNSPYHGYGVADAVGSNMDSNGIRHYYYGTGNVRVNNASVTDLGARSAGDVIGYALDADAGTFKIYINGTLEYTASYTSPTGFYVAGVQSPDGATHSCVTNFGQQPFKYDPPA